ncbi:hypothetical protein BGZ72_010339 [Mortierella alpina]|nr:hypothetical protein BGZ72_010339 [Mortierella alpina]
MRTTATIVTLATVACLLAAQVAADLDIQSSFGNALKPSERRDTLSQLDFLPAFLAASDENADDDNSGEEKKTNQASENEFEKSDDSGDCFKKIKTRVEETSKKFEKTVGDLKKKIDDNNNNGNNDGDENKGIPFLSVVIAGMECAQKEFAKELQTHLKDFEMPPFESLIAAVQTVLKNSVTKDLTKLPGGKAAEVITKVLEELLGEYFKIAKDLESCQKISTQTKLQLPIAHRCSLIEKTYRTEATNSITWTPLLSQWPSTEMEQTVALSKNILQYISWAPSNDDYLSEYRMNLADWLNQSRRRLLSLTDSDDSITRYANRLATVVSWGNALEACRAATYDPVTAAEVLAEHMGVF